MKYSLNEIIDLLDKLDFSPHILDPDNFDDSSSETSAESEQSSKFFSLFLPKVREKVLFTN